MLRFKLADGRASPLKAAGNGAGSDLMARRKLSAASSSTGSDGAAGAAAAPPATAGVKAGGLGTVVAGAGMAFTKPANLITKPPVSTAQGKGGGDSTASPSEAKDRTGKKKGGVQFAMSQ